MLGGSGSVDISRPMSQHRFCCKRFRILPLLPYSLRNELLT
jgi:hypothetical protein